MLFRLYGLELVFVSLTPAAVKFPDTLISTSAIGSSASQM